ncbi:PREDICTED: tripartite motif-containing protein 3-like [Amphimedon queenslandica]|uniref:RING-type domain-containing protein n=2 Tax=Amphimedon queenslandica TaxID=400682 RepID=A0AAN0IZN2_AMPQE|nr:PREDICTED: tripartite motif-containing protein 3-like [Amphimedon queenslandica]|eukprot:XP_019849913.1 PREDICTED: tripartite motif-containing protein 3-like [Amphimedon queenslandica]
MVQSYQRNEWTLIITHLLHLCLVFLLHPLRFILFRLFLHYLLIFVLAYTLFCPSHKMATKPSSSPGLLKLEEQLTCPVCLDHYTNPKALPCLHSFCQHCLEGLPLEKKNETYYLSCPTCRHCTVLPEEGARAFPVAFLLNNLEEMYILTKKTADEASYTCSDHGKPLELFCETCDTVICSHCSVRHHKHHEHNLIIDSYAKHCQRLRECLSPVEGKMEALKKALSALAVREGEIRERGERVLGEIHNMVEEIIIVLHQSEWKLTEQAKRVTNAKLTRLSEQIKSAEMSLSLLEDVEDFVKQSLKTDSPEQVLKSKKQMMERVSEVTAQINLEKLHPKEKADFVLSKDIYVNSLNHIGDLVPLKQCRVRNINHITPSNKTVSFSLSIEAPDSTLLTVPLASLRCILVPVGKGDQSIYTTITTTSTDPGVYSIQCNPSTSGTHTIKVQVYDVQLEDTSLVIPFNPYLDNITPICTITELNRPWGLAVNDDNHVIVTETNGNCVTLLDKKGRKVKSLGGKGGNGTVKFTHPCGIAITPDNFILVSDDHKIQKISMDGYCVASVGKEGSKPLQFKFPGGIAISHITGQAYIADYGNHRVQILNPDLTFFHSFGCKGAANGQFQSPRDIAIDSQGIVYVTDYDNHRIQKFSQNGKFVGQFCTYGSNAGQLNSPYGITIDTAATGLVYVSELGNPCIAVFTREGISVSRFGIFSSSIHQFFCPIGLAFDKDGVLYVCDRINDRLVVY